MEAGRELGTALWDLARCHCEMSRGQDHRDRIDSPSRRKKRRDVKMV